MKKQHDESAGHHFLSGGGELGALMRAYDWSTTPLGQPDTWPQSLKTAVRIMLTSRQPFWLGWGPELTYLYNDPYKSIIGGKHPQALGKPFREVWSEIWDVVGPMADTVMRNDEGIYAEAQMLIMERHGYQEETHYTFSYSPIPDEDGRPGGLICANTDSTQAVIGERQLATLRELAARTAEARSWGDACAIAVQALTANGRDATFALVFLGEADAFSLAAASPGAEALGDCALWPCREAVRDGALTLVELEGFPRELPAGQWQRPPQRAAVLPIASGQPQAGALVIGLNPFRQVDESYRGFLELAARQVGAAIANAQAYEQERRRAESLAQLDRAKTAFFSNVSHEFRTPLTLMLSPLEDALGDREQPLPPEQRERLEVMQRNGLRLQKLVNTLLDFSRIEAGRTQAAFVPTDLGRFTAELASSFEPAVHKASLTFEVDSPPMPEPAWVDRDMWEKIVLNLVSNAFKFTFEGSIGVRVRVAGDAFELAVRDTGTGIPAADLPHVFERFRRVEGAKSRTHEGTGIGLALVQELARLHGGEVRVESTEAKGSTFTVTIPRGKAHLPQQLIRAMAPEGEAHPHIAEAFVGEALSWLPGEAGAPEEIDPGDPPAAGRRDRIVWADDNADMREYVRRLLAARYEVEAVADGEQALAAVRRSRPDLVLTDAMMPRLDGLGLLRALREDPATRTLPIIILSARAGEEARIEGLEAGADAYMYKPFNARELFARVHARIELGRVQARLEEERATLETLNRIGTLLSGDLDLDRTVQAVTDAATEVSGAQFGAFFYNVTDANGESYTLYTLSGAPREAFEKFGMPRNTAVFAPTFNGEGVVRVDDITRDSRYGKNAPHKGMPRGHLPVRSYLAAPVISRSGEVIGGLFFGHPQPGMFTERAERLVTGIAAQAAVAIDNARLYQQRLQLIERLREEDRRKDEFLATLSHELRNPLAPLRNSLEVLSISKDKGTVAPKVREIMERQVGHLVRLVDDLMEMSRISRGTFELRRERVEVAAVVRNAIETSDPLIRAAGHSVSVSLPAGTLWLDGDPVRLAQILANLLNNAAKYTEPGGRITVEARREGEQARISVSDSGVGIAPEAMAGLFQMFSRGERSTRREQGGLGIGLALARKLAQMHGGTLEGHSEGTGKGSEFVVCLPLAGLQEPAPGAKPRAPAAVAARRILVVDDNRDAADMLAMMFAHMGGETRVANDGKEALQIYEAWSPAVVVLDIGMPEMDGYEVARRMRDAFPERKARFVALTGWGQQEDRQRAIQAGFDRHLTKPADIADLEALLTQD